MDLIKVIVLGWLLCLVIGCQNAAPGEQALSPEEKKALKKADHKLFHATLRKHLKATADRDIETLRGMMPPDGFMHLMRPATAVVYSSDKYLKYHELWFEDQNWNIETTITDSKVGTDMGFAIVDLLYKEKERDGKPYFNKMCISYTLQKYDDGSWYVIADHSSSIKKVY